jgi:prolyl oligopeptidase
MKLIREIQLPAVGTAGGFGGKKKRSVVLFFTNYTTPGTIYFLNLKQENQGLHSQKWTLKR